MHVDRSTNIMYHPDAFITYRGTDLLTLLLYYLLGKMKGTSHGKYVYIFIKL